jgi:hypothetical protein
MWQSFMKLLLDENLPKKLKLDFVEHEIYTVSDEGWNGVDNGRLLQLMIDKNYNALLTFDKNLQHQQNFHKYSITVFVLSAPDNTYKSLTNLSSQILEYLNKGELALGSIVIKLS